jgi:hypothetical protein
MERMRMPVPIGPRRPVILLIVGMMALSGVVLSLRPSPPSDHALRGAAPTTVSTPMPATATARAAMPPTPSAVPDDLPHATVVGFDHPGDYVTMVIDDGTVHFLVSLTGLPDGVYELMLENPTGGGALFGTGNAQVARGSMDGEAAIRPQNGQIVIWSIHPLRMLTSRDARIVLRSLKMDPPITRTSAALNPPLPSLAEIVAPDLMYATDVVSTLNGLGLNIQSTKPSIYAALFDTTTQAVFLPTNQGVLQVVFFPQPIGESLHIALTQEGGRYLYSLSGPLVGTEPQRIDSNRPLFFIIHDTMLLVTDTPELAELLEAEF